MAHPAYYDAHRVIPWIAGAFFFQGIGWVWTIGLHVHKVVKARLLVNITTTIVILGLNFWLIPRFWMMGAAAAASLSSCSSACVQVYVVDIYYPVPFEFRRVTKVALVVLGIYIVGSHIAWGIDPDGPRRQRSSPLCPAAPLISRASSSLARWIGSRPSSRASGEARPPHPAGRKGK
jgi:hypothetical protein